MKRHKSTSWVIYSAVLAAVSMSIGCNDHPLNPLDSVISATERKEVQLPPKTKIDFLWVVDNSNSMCEEQANLSRNFRSFADFLFNVLGDSADYRIAVTSTDLSENGDGGAFLARPAPNTPSLSCRHPSSGEACMFDDDCELSASGQTCTGENVCSDIGFVPDTAGCQAGLAPIIRSEQIADLNQLVTTFKCLATLGTGGNSFEKGLEAMRFALSCNGPNNPSFAQCCADGVYDPFCDTATLGEPEFLRPDAILVVIFVTDEADCSDPAANPAASKLAICKYGPADGDANGIPDGYRDTNLCGDLGQPECYSRECGNLTPGDCQRQRCAIEVTENSNCEWDRDRLVPIDDYYDFLLRLKKKPGEQLIVAAIAGSRSYTFDDNGNKISEISYNRPEPPEDPECRYDDSGSPVTPRATQESCCPAGACQGIIRPSCESANGIAFNGRRYLDLAARFGVFGIGCSPEEEGGADCVTICVDDFAAPLAKIKDGIIGLLGTYCLDKTPSCVAVDAGGSPRPCETEAEFDNANNYQVRVRVQCISEICARREEPRVLAPNEYSLQLGRETCEGGMAIELKDTPLAGSQVFVELQVDIELNQPAGTSDAATPAGPDCCGYSQCVAAAGPTCDSDCPECAMACAAFDPSTCP